jgi:tetratricopeptide (TPR) repeat protein
LTTPTGTDALSRAEALYRAADYGGAAALLEPLAAADQDAALGLLGLCRLRQGDVAEAVALTERAYALAPGDALAELNLGLALQAAGRHAEAVARFRSCQARLPDDPAPWLNRAVSLMALGQTAQALQDASEACYRAPDRPETHYTYGQAWLAADQPRRAEEAFVAALRLAPRLADAWVNLGVSRYRQNDIDGATTAMRSALVAAPGHRAATANLAAFLRLTGEPDAGEALLRDLLGRDPQASEARLNLAVDLLSQERASESLELLSAADPGEPRLRRHWLLQRSLALLQLGRHAEASAVLRQIRDIEPALAPLLLWRQVLLALSTDPARAREIASQLETVLERSGEAVLPEHRITARFDLAKFWSQQGAHEKAFANWAQGHAQLRRFQPFSREAYRDFVDASIAAFGAVRLADGPRAANADPTPVFVVGMPRSGTALAERILVAHRDIHGAGERAALGQAFGALGGHFESAEAARQIAARDAGTLDRAASRYLADLHALAPEASRIVDRMPGNFRYLGLVALMLPGARIIHCLRDPRDVGLSIFTFRLHGLHAYAHDLADLGWYIGEHERLMAHWRSVLPNPIMTVRLSDWVQDFAGTLARILAFLDLPYDPACERFHEAESRVHTEGPAQARQPVDARALGRWRPYARQLDPLIAELRAAGSVEQA